MKILIQDNQGRIFLRSADAWTTDPERALHFPNSMAAMEFCARHNLADAKVLLKFRSERFDIVLQPRPFPWVKRECPHGRLIPAAAAR